MDSDTNFYKDLLDNMEDGVYFVDRDRRITYWNKGAERITGYKSETVIGKSCMDNLLNHVTAEGKMLCLDGCPLTVCMQNGEPVAAEVFLHHAAGHRVPVHVRAAPIHDPKGEIQGSLETFSQATGAVVDQLELVELRHRSNTDVLTGLRNRAYVERLLAGLLSGNEETPCSLGILFIDVDKFKEVNDTFGHDIGDKVLKMVSNTIQSNLRNTDVVGRWGGDEFIAVIQDVQSIQFLQMIAAKIRMLTEVSRLDMENQSCQVTISVGGTLAQKGDTRESLVKRADELMYEMKRSGRNQVKVM